MHHVHCCGHFVPAIMHTLHRSCTLIVPIRAVRTLRRPIPGHRRRPRPIHAPSPGNLSRGRSRRRGITGHAGHSPSPSHTGHCGTRGRCSGIHRGRETSRGSHPHPTHPHCSHAHRTHSHTHTHGAHPHPHSPHTHPHRPHPSHGTRLVVRLVGVRRRARSSEPLDDAHQPPALVRHLRKVALAELCDNVERGGFRELSEGLNHLCFEVCLCEDSRLVQGHEAHLNAEGELVERHEVGLCVLGEVLLLDALDNPQEEPALVPDGRQVRLRQFLYALVCHRLADALQLVPHVAAEVRLGRLARGIETLQRCLR
eukprot:comp17670_c0_seq1/m.17474 comp17670_c0_seq1/g.17474  ORF comp17670_c0_seq1/g.17474 comp17670_c0_seq1/m.17474 type:complete len:312 (+) comp17670_c0_seq1:531-1466(+)